jgi:hypothetical protein
VFLSWQQAVFIWKEKRAELILATSTLQNGCLTRLLGSWQAAAQSSAAKQATLTYAVALWSFNCQTTIFTQWSAWAAQTAMDRYQAQGTSSHNLLGHSIIAQQSCTRQKSAYTRELICAAHADKHAGFDWTIKRRAGLLAKLQCRSVYQVLVAWQAWAGQQALLRERLLTAVSHRCLSVMAIALARFR